MQPGLEPVRAFGRASKCTGARVSYQEAFDPWNIDLD
jgi:hypothetical protein